MRNGKQEKAGKCHFNWCTFFDLQARATSEIAVADLNDSENR